MRITKVGRSGGENHEGRPIRREPPGGKNARITKAGRSGGENHEGSPIRGRESRRYADQVAKITKVGRSVGENHEGARITGRGQPDAKKSPEPPTSENLRPWHAKSIKKPLRLLGKPPKRPCNTILAKEKCLKSIVFSRKTATPTKDPPRRL